MARPIPLEAPETSAVRPERWVRWFKLGVV